MAENPPRPAPAPATENRSIQGDQIRSYNGPCPDFLHIETTCITRSASAAYGKKLKAGKTHGFRREESDLKDAASFAAHTEEAIDATRQRIGKLPIVQPTRIRSTARVYTRVPVPALGYTHRLPRYPSHLPKPQTSSHANRI